MDQTPEVAIVPPTVDTHPDRVAIAGMSAILLVILVGGFAVLAWLA